MFNKFQPTATTHGCHEKWIESFHKGEMIINVINDTDFDDKYYSPSGWYGIKKSQLLTWIHRKSRIARDHDENSMGIIDGSKSRIYTGSIDLRKQ